MNRIRTKRALASLLVLCVVLVGGVASAQALSHDSQHAHHQKATHSTVLCSWMCAAGQVLDTTSPLYLVEQSPTARAEQPVVESVPTVTLDIPTSRGPPFSFII